MTLFLAGMLTSYVIAKLLFAVVRPDDFMQEVFVGFAAAFLAVGLVLVFVSA